MKTIVLVLGILTFVLLVTLRLYVIWWNKQPYRPLSEETKRHSRIHKVIKKSFETCFWLFIICLIGFGISWLWTNADVRVFVI